MNRRHSISALPGRRTLSIFLLVLFMYPWASVSFDLNSDTGFQTGQKLWNTTAPAYIPIAPPAKQGSDSPAMIPASVGNLPVKTRPHGMTAEPDGSLSFTTLVSHLLYTETTSTRL